MNASTDKKPLIKRCLGKPAEFRFGVGASISYGNKALKMTEAA